MKVEIEIRDEEIPWILEVDDHPEGWPITGALGEQVIDAVKKKLKEEQEMRELAKYASERRFYVIPVVLTWRQVTKALGNRRPEFKGTEISNPRTPQPCGLAPGGQEYRVYNRWKDGTQSIHIVRHSNGMCISPSLRVECDAEYAEYAYQILKEVAGE